MADEVKEQKSTDDVISNAQSRMNKAVEVMKKDLNALRTRRATPALLENIIVDYYGVPTPLNQIASISTPEARLIVVQPWDRQALREIEKSLQTSELGFNPSNDGSVVRVPVPPAERRKETGSGACPQA